METLVGDKVNTGVDGRRKESLACMIALGVFLDGAELRSKT